MEPIYFRESNDTNKPTIAVEASDDVDPLPDDIFTKDVHLEESKWQREMAALRILTCFLCSHDDSSTLVASRSTTGVVEEFVSAEEAVDVQEIATVQGEWA